MISQLPAFIHPATGVLDPEGLLSGFGDSALWVACAILFVECGILFGTVLPGDSLLFIVGVFLASGFIPTNPFVAVIAMTACAILGNLLGYWVGMKVGPTLFKRPDSRIFKQEHVVTTRKFFDKFGPRAIVLARFIPIVRSFITAMAGIAGMEYRKYALYSSIGGAAWVVLLTVAGYFLGSIQFVKDHIDLVTLALVILSTVPIYLEVKRQTRELKNL